MYRGSIFLQFQNFYVEEAPNLYKQPRVYYSNVLFELLQIEIS
jgi:hypothetical protein